MEGPVTGCLCLDLGLLMLLVGLTVYAWIKHRYGYFARRGIPHFAPNSLLDGNVTTALGSADKSLGEMIDEIYKALKSQDDHRGYGGFFNFYKPSYLITTPEMVTKWTVEDFVHFNDHGIPIDEEMEPLEGHLFGLKGPKWRALRKKLTPTFTSGKLKWMFSLIKECGDRLIQGLDEIADTRKEIEMRDLLARFATDVIGSCAFGLNSESLKDPDSKFRRMGRKIFDPPLIGRLKALFRFIFTDFYKKLKIKSTDREVEDFFMSTFRQTMEYRLRTGTKRNDLIQLLLQLRESGSIEYEVDGPFSLPEEFELHDDEEIDNVKLELTDEVLAAQAFVFFIAGFETTSSATSYTLYLIAKHQDVQEKVRREVNEVLTKHGGKFTYDAIKAMVYLEACLNESMRVYPPFQLLPRRCTKDWKMEDGNVIHKGQMIIIPVYSLQHDPEYFDDPMEFRPERFLPGAPPPRPGSYLPFGFGPRICIAQRFAILESKLCLAMMIHKFKFVLGPTMIDPPKLVTKTFVNYPKGGVKVLIRRIDADRN